MIIRREETGDNGEIYSLVKGAFECAEHSDGNEHELVNALRRGEAYIPELSLVAEIKGKIAGHIMFTKARVGGHTVLALAPLSVLPEYQGRGIGTALIEEGHRLAKEAGYRYSVVLGDAGYYKRVGYLPAARFGIKPPFDVPSENFMACALMENTPEICGTMEYAEEFGTGRI